MVFFTVPLAVAESLKNTLTVNTTLGQTTCVKTAKYVLILILAVILERLLLCTSLVYQWPWFYSFRGDTISGALAVARYLCRVAVGCKLYGGSALQKTEVNKHLLHHHSTVTTNIFHSLFSPSSFLSYCCYHSLLFTLLSPQVDHWMEYSVREFAPHCNTTPLLPDLDTTLAPRVYFVGHCLTIADIAMFSALRSMLI